MTKKMTLEELKADVYRYAAKLSEETGVPLDPQELWEDVKAHIAKPPDDDEVAAEIERNNEIADTWRDDGSDG